MISWNRKQHWSHLFEKSLILRASDICRAWIEVGELEIAPLPAGESVNSSSYLSVVLDFCDHFPTFLMEELGRLPSSILGSYDDFYTFVHSVCLKILSLSEMDVLDALVLVGVFLMKIIDMFLMVGCFRFLVAIPDIFLSVFNDHFIKPFLANGTFNSLKLYCDDFKENEFLQTLQVTNGREIIEEAVDEEVVKITSAVGSTYHTVVDLMVITSLVSNDSNLCTHCGENCLVNIPDFFATVLLKSRSDEKFN
ncbi:hypothetical protein CDAR_511191 [Caerostris darwini]|uniref:Uncharacterized protein n=1 Tax=Caerostris darwini TaxID=1538125 RepID=A0AAV4S732_9ARAC|nr:hypothetical protein CDAR_511191 [Caerostris darwini]